MSGYGLEVSVVRGDAHANGGGEPPDAYRFVGVAAYSVHRRSDLIDATVLLAKLAERAAEPILGQAVASC